MRASATYDAVSYGQLVQSAGRQSMTYGTLPLSGETIEAMYRSASATIASAAALAAGSLFRSNSASSAANAPPVVAVEIRAIAHVHDTHQINGSVVEVGVHHGKFYLALDQARRDGERGFALDVFDSQGLNIDKSGKGSLHLFEQHLGRVSRQPNATRVVAGDSTRLAHSPRVRELLSPCRIFSLDGGHTAGHTASDLRFAESVLTNGGVVLVDDVMNPEWPGVFQGVSAYMASSPSLVPFAYAGNKLLLTTLSMHDAVLREYSRAMASYAVCRCWAGCPGLPKGSMCFANKPWFGHAVHSAVGLGDGGLRGEHQKQLGPSDASAPEAEARGASGGGPSGANGARAGHKMRPGGTAAFLASRLASGLKS